MASQLLITALSSAQGCFTRFAIIPSLLDCLDLGDHHHFLGEQHARRLSQTLLVRRQDRARARRSEEHTSELQSRRDLVCRLLLAKKKKVGIITSNINTRAPETANTMVIIDE